MRERASTAGELSTRAGRTIAGAHNSSAAAAAEIVILTVPYAAQRATVTEMIEEIEGKILIDATVPLVPPKVGIVQLPASQSAVAAIQQLAGGKVRVVSAFQSVSAQHLADLDHAIDCDVLICGDDRSACDVVIGLCADIGLRGLYAGVIANSAAAEAPDIGAHHRSTAATRCRAAREFVITGIPRGVELDAASISRRTCTARSLRS